MRIKAFKKEMLNEREFVIHRYDYFRENSFKFHFSKAGNLFELIKDIESIERQLKHKFKEANVFFNKKTKTNLLEVETNYQSFLYKYFWSKIIRDYEFEDLKMSVKLDMKDDNKAKEIIATIIFEKEPESFLNVFNYLEAKFKEILNEAIVDLIDIIDLIRNGEIPLFEHRNSITFASNLVYSSFFAVYTNQAVSNVFCLDSNLKEKLNCSEDEELLKKYNKDTKLLELREIFSNFKKEGLLIPFFDLEYIAIKSFKDMNGIKDENAVMKIKKGGCIDEEGEISLERFFELKEKYNSRYSALNLLEALSPL